jgi:DNA/RNA-binding domain of Phe-tRNA-synthetase-like protein
VFLLNREMQMTRKRKPLTDEEMEQRHRLFLEQMAEASGLSPDEMERRWKDFLQRSDIDLERAESAGLKALQRIKKKEPLKITASLDSALAPKFKVVKERMGSKSNSEVIRRLIIEAYQRLES